jgi:hypothetical protein
MLMHTPESMAKFLRWKSTTAGGEPSETGSHITLSHLFGAEADSDQLLRTVLGLQDGTESLSIMSTFKKRKLAKAADDEQQLLPALFAAHLVCFCQSVPKADRPQRIPAFLRVLCVCPPGLLF